MSIFASKIYLRQKFRLSLPFLYIFKRLLLAIDWQICWCWDLRSDTTAQLLAPQLPLFLITTELCSPLHLWSIDAYLYFISQSRLVISEHLVTRILELQWSTGVPFTRSSLVIIITGADEVIQKQEWQSLIDSCLVKILVLVRDIAEPGFEPKIWSLSTLKCR